VSDPEGPPYLIVDTNVAVKWYLPEELNQEALEVLESGERGEVELLAPDSVESEFWNVLWQEHRKSELSLDEVWEYWEAFESSNLLLAELVTLMPEATEIAAATGCIIYDALFVALAELEDTVVITADEKLLKALKGSQYEYRVQHLRNVSELLSAS
jgi:predicted nucleic acid-binding protein